MSGSSVLISTTLSNEARSPSGSTRSLPIPFPSPSATAAATHPSIRSRPESPPRPLNPRYLSLWLAVIGFFVLIVATAENMRAAPALRGVQAADAMTSPVATCPDWITVQHCVEDVALRTHHSTLVLTSFDGHPSGLMHLPRLARIPTQQRGTLRVRDVATPLLQDRTCSPDDLLEEVLDKLSPGGGMYILVMDGQRLVGIITARDISRIAQRHTLRGIEGR